MKLRKIFAVASFAIAIPLLFSAQYAYADDSTTVTRGTPVTLKWNITGADFCEASVSPQGSYNWSGQKSASEGSDGITFTANAVGEFEFTCRVDRGNTSRAILTVTDTTGSSCSYDSRTQGQLKWGTNDACKANYNGTVQDGDDATVENDETLAPGYTGSLTCACNNGTWDCEQNPVCTPRPRCGSSDGGSFSNPPTAGLCAPGNTASSVMSIATEYTWNCRVESSSDLDFCSANATGSVDGDDDPTPAACGADDGETLNGTPTNLCAPGNTASSILTNIGGHAYTWTCSSGNVESCWANSSGAASCGTTHYSCVPSSITGTVTTGGIAGPWTWRCIGSDTIPVNCSEPRTDSSVGGTNPPTGTTPNPAPCQIRGGTRYECSGSGPGSHITITNNCGQSRYICQYGCERGACRGVPESSFVPFTAISNVGSRGEFQATGELLVKPMLIRQGNPTWIYWNVKDALCTVTGNGQTWKSPTCGADFESCGNGGYATNVKNISDDTTGAVTWDCLSSGSLGTGARTSCYRHNPIDGRVITCTPACNTSCTDTCIPPQYGGAPCGDLVTRSGGTCSSGLSTSDILGIINRVPNRLDSEIARDLINANVSPEAAKNALGDSNLNARVDEAFQDARNSQ